MLRRLPLSLGLGLAALASPSSVHAYQFDDVEDAFVFEYLSTPIAIHGRIVDERGLALDGAQLRLIGFGEGLINDGEAATSWAVGGFDFEGLARRNALLEISLAGYYTEVIPVELQRPIDEDLVELGDIELVAEQFGRARLSFAGDAMFGRRMVERGLLRPDSLAADTAALFQYVAPILLADDHTAINLETPVTDQLLTPHPDKSFLFHAAPASAAALPGVGVDSVNLANNHVYDYLAVGLVDTLANLSAIGLPHYGAGLDESDAAARIHRMTIHGLELSLQGFSGIRGSGYEDPFKLVALDNPDKPGALFASTEQIAEFVDGELAQGRIAIAQFHGGDEYASTQTAGMRADFLTAIGHGAALVVAHHPHVVHGVQWIDAFGAPRFVFGSLGNFVFDQEIFETLRSYVAVVDVGEGKHGPAVERVRLVPVALDDYAPRLLVGDALAKFARHVAGLSTGEAALSGMNPAMVFAEDGRLVVAADGKRLQITDLIDTRELPLIAGRTGVVALEPFTPTDALAGLRSDAPARCELGRDLLQIGDFEDPDVDGRAYEGDGWDLGDDRYIVGVDVHSGTGALVLLRHSVAPIPAKFELLRRVAVGPGRRLSLHGWQAGDNAGPLRARIRWLREDGSTIATTEAELSAAAKLDWAPFEVALAPPIGAASLALEFEMDPPAAGEGRRLLDDLALIEWAPQAVDVDGEGVELPAPNAWEYLRCEANGDALALTLVHRTYATTRRRVVLRIADHPTQIRAR